VDLYQPVRETLGLRQIGNPGEGVVFLAIGDPMPLELACQDFVAMDTDLDGQRKPRLDADMHQSHLPVQEVEVERQALAAGRHQPRPALAGHQLETCHGSQDADQALTEPFVADYLLHKVFLLLTAVQVDHRPPGPLGHRLRMLEEASGMLLDETSEVLGAQAVLTEHMLPDLRANHRQVALEHDPVETAQDTANHLAILMDEAFYGVLLSDGGFHYHHAG